MKIQRINLLNSHRCIYGRLAKKTQSSTNYRLVLMKHTVIGSEFIRYKTRYKPFAIFGSVKHYMNLIPIAWHFDFQENFDSLDDYITYEYTSRSKAPNGDYPHDKVIYHLEFPDTVDLEEDHRFVLLYFQSTKNVTSLVGISEPFKAEKRCPSPRFESVD